MDDLSGLSWNSKPLSATTSRPTTSQHTTARFSPSPSSSRGTTPAPAQQAAKNGFANLLSPSQSGKAAGPMSMQEKQKQLMEEKARQAAVQKQAHDAQFAANDASFWNSLGSGSSRTVSPMPQQQSTTNDEDEEDILAAFNASAPVDKSSHFPPPNQGQSGRLQSPHSHPPASRGSSPLPPPSSAQGQLDDDDDDPFGLGQMEQKPSRQKTNGRPHVREPSGDDDDILGLLGKPVDQSRRRPDESPPRGRQDENNDSAQHIQSSGHPQDKAIAELVDMGFPADKAREALVQTDTGTNVQAAVGLLLNAAHEEARSRSRNQQGRGESPAQPPRGRTAGKQNSTRGEDGGSMPAWMRKEAAAEPGSARDSSTASHETDVAQYAHNLGNTFLKSANSLWKTSQKKVQKAYAEFQQDGGDPSKPRWMQEARAQEGQPRPQPTQAERATDEAMMLEMQGPPPDRRRAAAPERQRPQEREREHQASLDQPSLPTRPRPDSSSASRPREKLSRQAVEEQSAQAYVSSARRRKPAQPTPPPAPTPAAQQEEPQETLDIFSSTPAPAPKPSKPTTSPQSTRPKPGPSTVPAPRKPAPARNIPSVSASTLSSSASHRQNGSAAFKRGDYAEAYAHYTSALSGIPDSHPLVVIILCNRALTCIKTGDPKAAIVDADKALATIGPSRGDSESIPLGAEGEKPMKEFYGKALTRKAEALEALEKWADAASAWRQAVESGVGGPQAIQGRNRCDKAAQPAEKKVQTARKPAASKPAAAKPKASAALSSLNGGSTGASGGSGAETEAVRRLREQNAAAEAASDEAFALTDAVEARLIAWKGTKADNLRALLASLDTVLWPSAGWKKVGMGDLVMPNKVKIIYMKAIAKVHPDKIAQDASTEQKMISAAVFATLNEAWDKFKKDNGL